MRRTTGLRWALSLLSFLVVIQVNHALNFDEIILDTESNDTVLLHKWKDIEDKARSGMETIIRMLMPSVLRMTYEVELSPECMGAMLTFISGIKDMKFWALNMIDASGKPGGGQMRGVVGMLGNYDECVETVASRESSFLPEKDKNVLFRGQYCTLTYRPPMPVKPSLYFRHIPVPPLNQIKFQTELMEYARSRSSMFYFMGYRFGLCVPSKCSRMEIQELATYVLSSFNLNANVSSCEVKEEPVIDEVQITVLTVSVFFIVVTLIASIVEYIIITFQKSSNYPFTLQISQALSVTTNAKRTFASLSPDDDSLSCLHGIRFLSIGWVVLAHCYSLLDPVLYGDGTYVEGFLESFTSQTVTNAGPSVDSFLFIGGLLLAYNLTKYYDLHGWKVFNVPLLVFKRVWRLLPSAMMVIGLTTLMPLLGSGPLWKEEVVAMAQKCREHWWTVPLFINNFFNFSNVPIVSFWYIAVDLQCYLLGLVFLYLYFKKKIAGYIFNGCLIVGSIISMALVVYFLDLLPTVLMTVPDKTHASRQFLYIHKLPNVHTSVYGIGMALGVYLARKQKGKLHIVYEIIGWPFFLGILYTVINSTYIWNRGVAPTTLQSVLYGCLHRPAWALGLAWITYMCATGRGGLINDFLAWRAFGILNRLTYLVYLVHVSVNTFFNGSLRGTVQPYQFMAVFLFLGGLTLCFGVSFLMRVFFEAPIIELERIVLKWLLSKKGYLNQNVSSKSQNNTVINNLEPKSNSVNLHNGLSNHFTRL